jgi:RecA-family ATPase
MEIKKMKNIITANNPEFFKESLSKYDFLKEAKVLNESIKGLPENEVGLLVAPGATGKSYFVLNILLASCGLTKNHLIEREMNVLYVSLEDRLEDIQRRMAAYKTELNLTKQKLVHSFYGFDIIENKSADRLIVKGLPQSENSIWLQLEEKIKSGNYALVIIDTLIKTYMGFEENNNADMSIVLSHFNTLASDCNCSILLLHHTNKGAINQNADINQSISRGASSLVDNSRFVLSLQKNKDDTGIICKSIKTNFSAPTCQEYYRGYKGALIMEGSEEEVENVA